MPESRGTTGGCARTLSVGLLTALLAALLLPFSGGNPAAAQPLGQPIRVEGAVRFVVEEGGVLTVDGQRSFRDTVELLPGGPTLVNELALEDYVAGVAEMPARWPLEALKAQAVAARTYAWYSIGLGTFADYDICATTACQVFRGADVVLDEGERWQQAVDATAGEVLVDGDGAPILARYFSTSGGRTYANEEVFPDSGARDYLVGVEDPDDAVSPYHRWSVTFSRGEFEEILSRGETLAAAVPVASVERLGDVTSPDAAFAVTGTDGTRVEVSALDLRDFLSRVAPDAFPDRFPTARSDRLRPLPTTVPSTRFEVEVTDDEVVLEGRGWGHGVGMGQYGARGRAERGESYDAILSAYYGGLVPSTPDDLPARIRVGIDGAAEHTLHGDLPVTITDAAGDVLVDPALGTWTAAIDGDAWVLSPPAGSDAALEVAPTRRVEALFAVRDAVTVETEVNKPVLLRLEVRDEAGTVVLDRPVGTADAGTHAATWRFVDADGAPVPAGEYRLSLLATDAAGSLGGQALLVTVDDDQAAAAGDGATPGAERSEPPTVRAPALAAVAAIALVSVLALLARRKARS